MLPLPSVALSSGLNIPLLGLGCYKMPPAAAYNSVLTALQVGYRHIDTAALYENEAEVGRAIRDSGVPREDVFVTTKLWWSEHGYDACMRAFDRSLDSLGLDYVDMYLMHSPMGGKRGETWRAMEDLQRKGYTRAIGVSNFGAHHLDDLLKLCREPPQVNQVELSPYLTRRDLVDFCHSRGVAITAYSPLTKGARLSDPRLAEISVRYGKTSAQLLIRWCLQKGFITIPKSVKPERILENLQVFDFQLTSEDMAKLESFNENLVTGWDPTSTPL